MEMVSNDIFSLHWGQTHYFLQCTLTKKNYPPTQPTSPTLQQINIRFTKMNHFFRPNISKSIEYSVQVTISIWLLPEKWFFWWYTCFIQYKNSSINHRTVRSIIKLKIQLGSFLRGHCGSWLLQLSCWGSIPGQAKSLNPCQTLTVSKKTTAYIDNKI